LTDKPPNPPKGGSVLKSPLGGI